MRQTRTETQSARVARRGICPRREKKKNRLLDPTLNTHEISAVANILEHPSCPSSDRDHVTPENIVRVYQGHVKNEHRVQAGRVMNMSTFV